MPACCWQPRTTRQALHQSGISKWPVLMAKTHLQETIGVPRGCSISWQVLEFCRDHNVSCMARCHWGWWRASWKVIGSEGVVVRHSGLYEVIEVSGKEGLAWGAAKRGLHRGVVVYRWEGGRGERGWWWGGGCVSRGRRRRKVWGRW